MCGINGIYKFKNKSIAENQVAAMNLCIQHRGPDADGLWSNDHVVLGHRRLSIIDTSPAGNQPFHSADRKLTVVFNGEIYNYLELKAELKNEFEFTTKTDTEVLLNAYRKWGTACVDHFIGMFAFALWDEDSELLLIARDRLGIKPLYYHQHTEGFIFSSEIRPIIKTGLVAKRISNNSLREYLSYQTVLAPNTIIEGVNMLMPGHLIICSGGNISTKQYWSPQKNAQLGAREHSSAEARKNILSLLQSSVELRMRADVPFGAFLSGGIDSSAVVGLMSKIATQQVKTFSITFHEHEFDEGPYAKMIADKFQTDHHDIKLHATDFLKEIPSALSAMDHPSGDGPNTFVVSKVTREAGVKMALSGLGGDEVFAGYDVFKRMHSIEQKQWLNIAPQPLRRFAGNLLKQLKPSIASDKIAEMLALKKIDFAHAYPLVRKLYLQQALDELLYPSNDYTNPVDVLTNDLSKSELPMLSKVSVAEMCSYMQNTLLRDTDQMSMAHALEVRVPFLDHRLVEYVLGVKDSVKFPHTPKQLLTESLGDLLPREIIDRPKMGFTFPWPIWMRNELNDFCHENILHLQHISHFKNGRVEDLWNRFMTGDKAITWSRIWPLVVLGHWIKTNDIES